MKNSYLIIGLLALAAILIVAWYSFKSAPKLRGWTSFTNDVVRPAAWTKCNCIDENGIKTGACMSPNGSCSCCSGSDYI